MRLVPVILLVFALPGNAYGEGIESESYYYDENTQENVNRRPADAVVVVRGPVRPGSSSTPAPVNAARPGSSSASAAPTSTTEAPVPSPPPAPETRSEEDDLLQFFNQRGKKRLY